MYTMTKVIAISSAKGGIGKTTTAVNLSARLAHYGKRTLLIDCDSQGQSSNYLCDTPNVGLYEFIEGKLSLKECLIQCRESLYLLAGGQALAQLENALSQKQLQREFILQNALAPANEYFDYVIIDCAPSWSLLNINVLIYANETLIPVPLESLAIDGLVKFLERIQPVLELTDNHVKYIVPTMVNKRFAQSSEIMEQLRETFPHLLTEPIRVDIRLSESPSHDSTIYEYAPKSRGAADYDKLTKHIMGVQDGT